MKVVIAALSVALTAGVAVPLVAKVVSVEEQQDDTATQAEKSFYEYPTATGNIEPVGESPPVTESLIEHGHWVFRGLCIGCHGVEGNGEGAVWTLGDKYAKDHKLPRMPRDFTQAVFKVRSTPSGSLPTDADLFKAISRGLVADQDMPSFKYLPERDRWAVIAYIKTLSARWQEEKDWQEPPVEVGDPPVPTEEMITAGKEVYKQMKCAKCHGPTGKGDGPSAAELEDDAGLPITPRDFSDPAKFVGSSEPRGIYQTFTTGLDGTPMPTFADFLDEQQRWELVWYVMSLRPDFNLEKARAEVLRKSGDTVAQAAGDGG